MDKKEELPKKKPATRGGKATGPSKSNGSSSPAGPSTSASSSGPETIMKKMSSGNLSPLTQRTPGRLPSLTPKRNLSLVTEKAAPGVKNSVSGAAETVPKPKKAFVPNLASGRRKPQQAPAPVIKQEVPDPGSARGRGRGRGGRGDGGSSRGRGRGKPELIQTGGGLFSDGVTELTRRDRNFGQRESSAGSSGLERPKLNLNVKVNQKEEDAKLAHLLNDDFIEDDEEYDPNALVQPLTLPKSKMEKLPEVKLEIVKLEAIEAMEVDAGGVEKEISVGGGVKIKQEKMEVDDLNLEVAVPSEIKSDIVPKSKTVESKSMFQRRLNPSDITAPQMIEEEGTILFIQLPDVLPTNKPQIERPMIKNEPGVDVNETVNETATNESAAEEQKVVSVFDDVPEGQLGFLLVHQSGKITLQVGEQNFVVDSSAQISYLQDLISVEVDPEDKSGTMTNIGRIKFKGVCLPDWEDLIDDS